MMHARELKSYNKIESTHISFKGYILVVIQVSFALQWTILGSRNIHKEEEETFHVVWWPLLLQATTSLNKDMCYEIL
jgi:hypothetical protein